MDRRLSVSTRSSTGFQWLMPLIILLLLFLVNLTADIIRNVPLTDGFFWVKLITDNFGNIVFSGTIVNILNGASEVAIMAIGMTLVTAASGGQDISVGAVAAIAGSVFLKVVRAGGDVTWLSVIFAFLISCAAAMLCGVFNGTLVSVFKIQPMIATLVLFTSGRSIAYAINGGASPKLFDELTRQIGGFFSGVLIPTPVFIVALYGIMFFLIFMFTNLRLYAQAVGINEKSARLNGLNPVAIKLMTYVILGICVAGAGVINTCRMQRVDHLGILGGIEMDAILAVAVGGNALSGGKFSVTGSIIGAYAIETLNVTLLRLGVEPEPIKAYKAVFIILLMFASSPVVKKTVGRLWGAMKKTDDGEDMLHVK